MCAIFKTKRIVSIQLVNLSIYRKFGAGRCGLHLTINVARQIDNAGNETFNCFTTFQLQQRIVLKILIPVHQIMKPTSSFLAQMLF